MLETGKKCVVCTWDRYIKDFPFGSDICFECKREDRDMEDMEQIEMSSKYEKKDPDISLCRCKKLYCNKKTSKKGNTRTFDRCYLCR